MAYGIVVNKLIVLEQGIKHWSCNHVLSQHLNSLLAVNRRIYVLLQAINKLIEIRLGFLVFLNKFGYLFDEFLGNLANFLRPVSPIHLVANLLHDSCIYAILKRAEAKLQLPCNIIVAQSNTIVASTPVAYGILIARNTAYDYLCTLCLV